MRDPGRQSALIEALAGEKISVMTVGSPSAPALPLRLMRQAGIVVASRVPGGRGATVTCWSGQSNLAQRNGVTNDIDLEMTLDICTRGGADGIGLTDYGLIPGCAGNLVLVPARTVAEAVALTPQRRTVISRGVVIVERGMSTAVMPAVE